MNQHFLLNNSCLVLVIQLSSNLKKFLIFFHYQYDIDFFVIYSHKLNQSINFVHVIIFNIKFVLSREICYTVEAELLK